MNHRFYRFSQIQKEFANCPPIEFLVSGDDARLSASLSPRYKTRAPGYFGRAGDEAVTSRVASGSHNL